MYKILIVEDDETIANEISNYLKKWNLETKLVKNLDKTIETFLEYNPHLILLDINLPHYDGYYYCEQIRKLSKIPIIFISSAVEDMNIVMAVNLGADDFITKPFKLILLKAKIDAILRRVYNFNVENKLITHRGVVFDIKKDLVIFKDKKIELTKNESKILQILLEHRENIVIREDIIKLIWETNNFIAENTLSVNINRLRNKLETIGIKDYIITKKGRGYMIC